MQNFRIWIPFSNEIAKKYLKMNTLQKTTLKLNENLKSSTFLNSLVHISSLEPIGSRADIMTSG